MKLIFLSFFLLILSCKSIKEYEYIADINDSKYIDFLEQSGENAYTNIVLKNGKYYLYKPCDLGYRQFISLDNDKVTIETAETVEYRIHHVNSYNNVTVYDVYDDFGKGKLLMKTLDNDKTIFKLEYENVTSYFLMTSFSSAQNYTLIIHNCKEKKAEMIFDDIDLENIWNNGFEQK